MPVLRDQDGDWKRTESCGEDGCHRPVYQDDMCAVCWRLARSVREADTKYLNIEGQSWQMWRDAVRAARPDLPDTRMKLMNVADLEALFSVEADDVPDH